MISAFYPYLGVVKDRLSGRLSEQILNNFEGIIGRILNFGTDKLFSISGDSTPKKMLTQQKVLV